MKKQLLFFLLLLVAAVGVHAQRPDIVAVKGTDPFASAHQAIAALGGMEQFVQPGQSVGILVNSAFNDRGAYVNPDVVIAAIKMAYDAGASDIVFLQHIVPEYWERSALEPQYREMIARTRTIEANQFPAEFSEEYFVKVPAVEGAATVKDLEIIREFLEVDVFINIPIAKNHTLTGLTNAMKNVMGINSRASNVTFHLNGPARNDPEYLAQCIAELNLLRPADLIISDATYSIVTNGPTGPGEIVEPRKVVAGIDPVAIDVYCAELTGFFVEDVYTIQKGFELGLGQKDLSKLTIREIELEP